ncbi:MAG: hypothetical protein JSS52_11385 [Proteobacteria bacterium]|nr:hypothetical protein [Pseudomonadota bacterium]
MSNAVVTLLSPGEAQRLTQRIKLTASTIRDNLFKLRNLVDEAKNSNAWQVLGFPSWTAYLADTLADEPMRLGREERQELVGYLSGEGLSTRAIAPIVGVHHDTVASDIKNVAPVGIPTPEPGGSAQLPDEEVTAPVESAPRAVTGLDGKTYTRPTPKPVVVTEEDSLDYDAKQIATRVSDALQTLRAFRTPEHRERVLSKWWPHALKNEEVPPWGLDLFKPEPIRQIAQALTSLANELEGLK